MREYFPLLLGNEETRKRIGAAVEGASVPHAFLIGGPSGSGKSTLAIELAAAVNCENKNSPEHSLPCGKCNSCKRIHEGNFTDVKILSKKKDKATLGVSEIKDFREDMFLSSTESEHKIYIIDDAECMTPEAQNALLKVLEEPPQGVMILLLAKECDRILTTIKSRTQYVAMGRFSEEEIEKFLVKRSEDARRLMTENREKLLSAVMSADGRLGLALQLVDARSAEENLAGRELAKKLITAFTGRGVFSDIHAAVFSLPQKRGELAAALELCTSAIRDLIVLKEDPTAGTVFYTSKEEAIKVSTEVDRRKLFAVYDALCEAAELCQKNANVGNVLTSLTSRIKFGKSVR